MTPQFNDFVDANNSPRLTMSTTPTSGISAPPLKHRLGTMLTRGDSDVLNLLHVVDDLPMNRKMLMLHLKGLGVAIVMK
jgi:hypothetical protein